MRCPLVVSALSVASLLTIAEASAQLRQPRCQGWPARTGDRGRTGLVLNTAGGPCYGAVMDSVRRDCTLLGSRVVRAPRQGSFQLTGLMDFAYTAQPGMRGPDRIEIGMDWECRGLRSSNRAVLNAMTHADYAASGGTSGRPPDGYGYDAR